MIKLISLFKMWINSKSKSKIEKLEDGVHYKREIGLNKIIETKTIYGFSNELPKIDEDIDYLDNHKDKTIALAMEVVIQVGNLWEDGIREITPKMKEYLEQAVNILSNFDNKTNQINSLIKHGNYYLNNMSVLECNDINK